MDIASIIGLVGSQVLIVVSIMIGGDIRGFIDIPSIIIVIGGGITTLLSSMTMGEFFNFFRVGLKVVFPPQVNLKQIMTQLVEFATVARRDGILALENHLDEKTNKFVATGIRMAVDGTDPELIEKLMLSDIESLQGRHKNGKVFFDLFAKYAPAFGMIGTLIGLVAMLANLSDPSAIGPGMAVALLTTLYGAVIANAICLPMADKLAFYSRMEVQARMMIVQGVMAIQSGDNPRIVEQKLNVFLAPNQRASS
ncbi:MotA/TolQ/ExbB proton channel family protein [bacterium]|nr:MotA/TolQ/ExbB proton channel family protein [bacterium]